MVPPPGDLRGGHTRSPGPAHRRRRLKKESFDSVYDTATTLEFMEDPVNTDGAELQVTEEEYKAEGLAKSLGRLPRYQQASILAIIVIGIACAVVLFIVYRVQEKAEREHYFVVSMKEQLSFLENTIQGVVRTMAVLSSYQTLTLAQGPVVAADFQDFVNVLNENSTETEPPYIPVYGWVPRVKHTDREKFEAEMQSRFPDRDYYIYTAGSEERAAFPKEEYYTVANWGPPHDRGVMSLGMDMTSSAVRAEAIVEARDSGTFAVTSPLNLGEDELLSILIVAPIYRQRPVPPSVSERQENILGVSVAAVQLDWLMQTSFEQFNDPDDGFVLGMIDVTNPDRPIPLVLPDASLVTPSRGGILPGTPVERDDDPVATTPEDGPYKKVKMLNLGNRRWRIIIRPSDDSVKRIHGSAPWVILVSLSAVAIATACLVLYIWLQLARSNKQRQRLNRSIRLLGKQSARHAKAKMKAIEMTRQQIVLTEEAHRARNAKAQFLANMSHEIRTPMNGVIGLLHVLDMATDIPSEHRVHIKLALTAAQHLLRILNDILDFSKAAEGKLLMEAEPFDLYHSIESVVQVTSCSESAQNVEITLVFGDGVPRWLVGDAGRLLQLVANLLNNAVKFSSPGKVVLTVTLAEYTLSDPIHPIHAYDRKHGGNSTAADTIPIDKARLLALMAEDDAESEAGAGEDREGTSKKKDVKQEVELLFKVTDSGIGMKEDQIRRLFKPFEQADRSTTRRFGGTGLGLTISRTLTETMGGRIWAESEGMRKGSTFLVQIPMRVDPNEHPDTQTDSLPARGILSNSRILVVNENRVSIQNIETILRRHGCVHITTALSSETALAHYIGAEVDEEPFDLLIIDSTMPPVDGVTLLWEMRSSAESRSEHRIQAPCIILSGIGERDVVSRKLRKVQSSSQHRKDILVTKPIAADLFMKQVINFLSNTASPSGMSDSHASRSPSTVRRLVEGLRILRIAYLEDQYRLGSVVIRTYFSQCSVPTPRFFQSPTEILAAHTRTPFDLIFLSLCEGVDTPAVIKVMRELRASAQRKAAQFLDRHDMPNSPGTLSRSPLTGMPPLAPERALEVSMYKQHSPILALVVPAPEWEKDFPEAVGLPHSVLVEPVMFESVQALVESCKQRLRGPDTNSPQFSPMISSRTPTDDLRIKSLRGSDADTLLSSDHGDLDSLDDLMLRASDRLEGRQNQNDNTLERHSGEMEVSDMSDANAETVPSVSQRLSPSESGVDSGDTATATGGRDMAPADSSPPFDEEGNPLRCLIVDDMHVNRKILNTLYRKLYPGCETQEAEDGLRATQMASSTMYGIILMDITMPVMDGIEAATEIRATEAALGAIPACIIAVSATSVADQAPQCRRAGYDGYLEKPVTVPRLRAAITDALASYKKNRGTSALENGVALN